MGRKLDTWELNALDQALKAGKASDQIKQEYGETAVDKALAETGLRLPGADASKISDRERELYIKTLGSTQDLWSNITDAGVSSGLALQRLNEAQLYVPLVQDQQEVFDWASENKVSAGDLATATGISDEVINTNLTGAGLSLPGGSKDKASTGLPRQQTDGGGMYGFAPAAETPRNVVGQIPMLPQLRNVRKNAKRQNDPNWKGTTDTILTSGRGLLEPANTSVKTLLGS